MCFFLVVGIDGLVDMKHICGTIVARKRGKQGKEGKVSDLVVNKSPRKTHYSKQKSHYRTAIFGSSFLTI